MEIKTSTSQLRDYLETKQGKTYFIAIITLITVTIMLVFAIVPAVKSITDKVAQNNVRRDYLDALTQKESNIKELIVQEEQSQAQIAFLDSSLPSKRNDEFILANIGEMAKISNSYLVSADFGTDSVAKIDSKVETKSRLKQVPVTISIQGTIPTLGEFIKKMESFPMPFTMESTIFGNKDVRSQKLPLNRGDSLLIAKINYYYYDDVTE
jgi:Tfp pilus assembly protein PilO